MLLGGVPAANQHQVNTGDAAQPWGPRPDPAANNRPLWPSLASRAALGTCWMARAQPGYGMCQALACASLVHGPIPAQGDQVVPAPTQLFQPLNNSWCCWPQASCPAEESLPRGKAIQAGETTPTLACPLCQAASRQQPICLHCAARPAGSGPICAGMGGPAAPQEGLNPTGTVAKAVAMVGSRMRSWVPPPHHGQAPHRKNHLYWG